MAFRVGLLQNYIWLVGDHVWLIVRRGEEMYKGKQAFFTILSSAVQIRGTMNGIHVIQESQRNKMLILEITV